MSGAQPRSVQTEQSRGKTAVSQTNPSKTKADLTLGQRFTYALTLIPEEELKVIGRSRKQLGRYADGADMPFSVLVKVSAASGLPLDWLATGKSPELSVDRAEASLSDSTPVRVAEVRASASHGSFVNDEPARYMDFPNVILESVDLKPQNARIMETAGSSMEPTINEGDLILVDVSDERRSMINDGKVYVFSVADQVFVKRLRRASQGVFARSDNKDLFPEDELIPRDEPLSIFGRVVWSGRRH